MLFSGAPLVARHARTARKLLVASVAFAVVSTVLELMPYWLIYRAVRDLLAGAATPGGFLVLAVLGAVAVVAQYTLFGLSMTASHRAAFAILYELRIAIARRLARLPLSAVSGRRSGELKKAVIDETERFEHLIGHSVPDVVGGVSVWLGVTVWLFVVDWRLASAAVLVVLAAFACVIRAISKSASRMGAYQEASARMNGSIVEYLSGMRVVKVFNRSGQAFQETAAAVRDHAAVQTEWARAYIPLGGAFYCLVQAGLVAILPTGLWLLAAGEIDVPTLLFFVVVGAHYANPLLKIYQTAAKLAHITSGARVVENLLAEPELPDTGRRLPLQNGDVVFDRVSFAYGERPVLHEVSFTAAEGRVTALVGPSGAGKSTIARLIARFDDVADGRVLVGGHDVRDMGVACLMDTVAFVLQDTFLFHDTIEANIRMGRPQATTAEVEAAARAARVDFAPLGTVVGERGATLSGGERQRIAVARAILKDAPVIVLDEATSFADPDNEAAVQEALGNLTRGKTLVVVAHRLGTVAGADRIVVVDDGRVVEEGRHADLVAAGGPYARLWADYTHSQQVVLHTVPEGSPR